MENPIKIEDYEYKIYHAQQAVGYEFSDPQLLLLAITHPSAVPGKSKVYSYERLEFLGDSLLGAYVARIAYDKYPEYDEGKLSKVKISLVSGETLSEIADQLGLADSVIVGSSEVNTKLRGMKSALENIYESICAAIYLDGGQSSMEEFIDRTLISHIGAINNTVSDNSKSKLQEILQRHKLSPVYSIIDEFGPAHDKQFVAEVLCDGKTLASGQGKTKKEAEVNAARGALNALDNKTIKL